MAKTSRSLRQRGTRNPKPERVRDPLFESDSFFDPEDLVQVKYEMLRRVRMEGSTVSDAATRFGFSRPAFYEARLRFESDGLGGLFPKRPGPRSGHKLSEQILDDLEALLAQEAGLGTSDLAGLLESRHDLHVHPRSIERALARRRKKNAE